MPPKKRPRPITTPTDRQREACFKAIQAKDHRRLVHLLGDADLDIHSVSQDPESPFEGQTLLFYASSAPNHHLASVNVLLKHGADPNLPTRVLAGATPLHEAQAPAILKALLRAGGNPNIKDALRHSPLTRDTILRSPASVQALLDAGAKPNTRRDQFTAVELAACHHSASVKILLEAGARPTRRVMEMASAPEIFQASRVRRHQTEVYQHLLAADYSPRTDDLIEAAALGNADIIEQLIDDGIPLNRFGSASETTGEKSTPLLEAIRCRQYKTVEQLLRAGADPNFGKGEMRPLRSAVEAAQLKTVKLLVQHGADIDQVDTKTIRGQDPDWQIPERLEKTLVWLEKQQGVDSTSHEPNPTREGTSTPRTETRDIPIPPVPHVPKRHRVTIPPVMKQTSKALAEKVLFWAEDMSQLWKGTWKCATWFAVQVHPGFLQSQAFFQLENNRIMELWTDADSLVSDMASHFQKHRDWHGMAVTVHPTGRQTAVITNDPTWEQQYLELIAFCENHP